MFPEINSRIRQIEDLCRRHGVRRLELFGSGVNHPSGRDVGDLDFLVDLGDAEPAAYADAYFALQESLQALLGKPVDLVTASSVTNRYFRESIERSKELLYAA